MRPPRQRGPSARATVPSPWSPGARGAGGRLLTVAGARAAGGGAGDLAAVHCGSASVSMVLGAGSALGVADRVLSPARGTHDRPVTVTLISSAAGGTISYPTD